MRTSLLLACMAAVSAAQDAPTPQQTLSGLASSAQEELARSTAELDQLRAQIAADKLPLAQKLTGLEEKLVQLRAEHGRITLQVDEGNLQVSRMKGEMKAREDELDYVGNRLDEYARNLESNVNVSELQVFGTLLESAKQASENTTLTKKERFERQLALLGASARRLFDAVGGFRFPGVGVDLQGAVVEGQYALFGPVALFSAPTGVAGLVVPQSGSVNPLIRPLEGEIQAGLVALVDRGDGLLPLDPSRGGALKALVQKTSLIHIFEKGGPIMWPLLVASILALGTVIERITFLTRERRNRNPQAQDRLFAEVEAGRTESAIRVGQDSRDYVVRTLAYALGHKEKSITNALLYAQAQEIKRFQRGIPILDTVITLAPLLGLLGTVTGMMGSFSLIGGDLSAPGAITGGIAEALIATAFGLGIAITALLPFNYLNTKLEEARHDIESASTQLELLIQPRAAAVTVAA